MSLNVQVSQHRNRFQGKAHSIVIQNGGAPDDFELSVFFLSLSPVISNTLTGVVI